ncbi:MAG TPA: hypothetical protein VFM35_05140 [Candidatus Binatia bacterium]|nr:hypothetical protein [Candidatus Binatia bacterium]
MVFRKSRKLTFAWLVEMYHKQSVRDRTSISQRPLPPASRSRRKADPFKEQQRFDALADSIEATQVASFTHPFIA